MRTISLILILFMATTAYADTFTQDAATTNYGLPYLTRNATPWDDRLNLTIASIDTVIYGVSSDSVSRDAVMGNITADVISVDGISIDSTLNIGFTETTLATGGEVGRIAVISGDTGTIGYIKIYSGS